MNAQELFDFSIDHLVKQGVKSQLMSPDGSMGRCAYRGHNGTRCIIGALIPDEIYSSKLEDNSFFGITAGHRKDQTLRTFFKQNHPDLFIKRGDLSLGDELQNLHDGWYPDYMGGIPLLKACAKKLADKFGLNSDRIDELDKLEKK